MGNTFEEACELLDNTDVAKAIQNLHMQAEQAPYENAKDAYKAALNEEKEKLKEELAADDKSFTNKKDKSANNKADKQEVRSHTLSAKGAFDLINSGIIPREALEKVASELDVDVDTLTNKIKEGETAYLQPFNESMSKLKAPKTKPTAEEVCDHVLGDASDSHGLPNNMSGKTETAIG